MARLVGRAAIEGGARLCLVTTVLFLFQTLNDRSKPPQKYKLKLNLRPLLTRILLVLAQTVVTNVVELCEISNIS